MITRWALRSRPGSVIVRLPMASTEMSRPMRLGRRAHDVVGGLFARSIAVPYDAPALAGRTTQAIEQRRRQVEIGLHEGQPANHPPSTTRFEPVMKVARSLARKTAALAMSWGRPNRGHGVRRRA